MKQCDEEVIIDRYINGESITNLSRSYGVQRCTIYSVVNKYGVKPSDTISIKQRDARDAEIISLYSSGCSSPELAARYNMSDVGIRNIVKRNGVNIRSQDLNKMNKEQIELACELYKSGFSCPQISLKIGISSGMIRKELIKAGVERRSLSQANRIYAVDEDAFSSIDRDSAYWLGFIGSDGNIKNNQLAIGLHSKDAEHLHKFKEFMQCEHPVKISEDTRSCKIVISSEKISRELVELGVTERKSMTYTPDEQIANSPDYWRGMIDGDGWIAVDKKNILRVGLCGSKQAIEAFRDWVKTIIDTSADTRKLRNIYTFSLASKKARQLLNVLYQGSPKYFLDRKYEVAKKFLDVHSHI